MFGSKPTQKLVHLPGPPNSVPPPASQSPNQDLPRGQCRFILTQHDVDGSRQRCDCVSFSLNNTVPGTQCGCGHQAWHHIKEPTGNYVSMTEHLALVERCSLLEEQQRRLSDDLSREKMEREKLMKEVQQANYQNMVYLRYYFDEKMERLRLQNDDKLEAIEDKAQGALDETGELRQQVLEMDESLIRLEERLDHGRRASRSMTPLLESAGSTAVQSPPPERHPFQRPEPTTTLTSSSEPWEVKVILLLSRHLQYAPNMDSIVYKRCNTRNFIQDIQFPTRTAGNFHKAIEDRFGSILRMRAWMPMQCLRSSDMYICQLQPNQIDPALWDYSFLEQLCLAHDKVQGDIVYIALQSEDFSWSEVKSLPSTFGSDESCWADDEKLDGTPRNRNRDSGAMDYQMNNPRASIADTDSTYEKYNSPPPYQPGTPRQGPLLNQQSPLEVLADASSLAARPSHGTPSISERSNYSAPSMIGGVAPTIASLDSAISGSSEYDEHRDKRYKRHPLRPQTSGSSSAALTTTSSTGHISAPSSPPPAGNGNAPVIVYGGRTKRKLNPTNKYREPMDWRPTEQLSKFLHRHDSKDKEKRPTTSGSQASG